MLKRNEKVILETYKYDKEGHSISGDSKQVKIDRYWLEDKIKPQTINDFLGSYTYDDVEELLKDYEGSLV